MSLTAHERQCLAGIERELSADPTLVNLAGYIGKPAARSRRFGVLLLRWLGFPLAVGSTAGLVTALVLGVPTMSIVLAAVLAVLWPPLACYAWCRCRVRRRIRRR